MNDLLNIQTLRVLSMEEITKAKSGHPGIALGAAPLLYTLYSKVMHYSVKNPKWENRDRFVLAAGHGSSLLYATLHLAGFALTIDDLKNFRQLSSITPGHPEVGVTPGVDASSGPLGQGIPTSVGLAIAEEALRASGKAIDHYTYCLCSDAEIQEGIANEALSLAGHLKLNKLIVLMDSNDIQLDGKVSDSYTEDTKKKLEAYGWNYMLLKDGNDIDSLASLIKKAKDQDKPTFIECKTIIGEGCLSAGTNKCHGAPLSEEETQSFRASLGGEAFSVKDSVYEDFKEYVNENEKLYDKWVKENPNFKYDELEFNEEELYDPAYEGLATRSIVGKVLAKLSEKNHSLIGGSADLASSCQVRGANGQFQENNRCGRDLAFGVREHAMGAICNGLALHGGLHPYCGGFFVFSDYAKPAIRMSALSHANVTYIFSHDSIAVGEDGPTHQPIEQLTGLRAIPNLTVIRPCNAKETIAALHFAFTNCDPTFIVTTRQTLLPLDKEASLLKGAYEIVKVKNPKAILLASGSEVSLAIDAHNLLKEEGIETNVVSIPSIELFEAQGKEYKDSILPSSLPILALEMSEGAHYYKYTRNVLNISSFGKSGKAKDVIADFGFTKEKVAEALKEIL